MATATTTLLENYRQLGDPDDRDRLASDYMPLVRGIARRFRFSREPQEDLVQTGVIGLLGAIEKFDPRRGVRFVSLAFPAVLGSMLNYLRDQGGLVKVSRTLRGNGRAVQTSSEVLAVWLGRWPTAAEISTHCGLTQAAVDEALEFGRNGSPCSLDQSTGVPGGEAAVALLDLLGQRDKGYEAAVDRITLECALDTLPPREKTIISLKFYGGMSQRQIAGRINLSQMHVSRLERSALRKLRSIVLGEDLHPGSGAGPDRRSLS